MVTIDGDWNWQSSSSFIPLNVTLHIYAIKSPLATTTEGIQVWCRDPLHSFSIRSAYLAITNDTSPNAADTWSLITKFKGSPRVRSFLWLVSHDRIMTNHERTRRHLIVDQSYDFCEAAIENTLHALRDCPVALAIWSTIIKPDLLERFCSCR
ncbi:hypothetical protein V6N13_125102 [Hibiscus sabdariffa]|uniref:Reverse transcriptase zinc-binding domain-containing protein n=1 Tax=Hibiscus sabdariffa TaxID=183260 RepID=A0ABR2U517_9ROSI